MHQIQVYIECWQKSAVQANVATFQLKKDKKMREMTLTEISQASGGVVDADLIISASYTICPAFAAAMTVGYYFNKLC